MPELESLALLIADMNTQIRALQQENAKLRQHVCAQPPADPTGVREPVHT